MAKFGDFFKGHWYQVVLLMAGPVFTAIAGFAFLYQTTFMRYSILNVRRWPSVDPRIAPGKCVLHSLLFAAVLLVFLNTLVYLRDAFNHRRVLVLLLYFVSVGVAIIWATEIYFGWITDFLAEHAPEVAFHLHEFVAILLFGVFAFMDGILYFAARSKSQGGTGSNSKVTAGSLDPAVQAEETKRREEASKREGYERQTYGLQFWAVDIPVVVGILIVVSISHFSLEHSLAVGHGPAAKTFDLGFRAGALVMHLAVSQVVFAVIYFIYFKNLYDLS